MYRQQLTTAEEETLHEFVEWLARSLRTADIETIHDFQLTGPAVMRLRAALQKTIGL